MIDTSYSKNPQYNLSYVLQETGIKADTLRAWERRYQLPQPQRTEGGHRLFSEFDIQTVMWLIAHQKEGLSISRAVRLWRDLENQGKDPLRSSTPDPLPHAVTKTSSSAGERLAKFQNAWVQACLNFDEAESEQLLTQAFAQFPLETVCMEILLPGLFAIGKLWHLGKASVQQEHFATALANQRLQALIAAAPKPVRDKTILVVCAPGESHTFSALLISLLLRYRSWKVVYLGANVPQSQLLETIENTQSKFVVITAMRLVTSAALYETAIFLKENDIPVGYGGWIFNQTPALSEKIPGHYLGGEVAEAISSIENLMIGSIPEIKISQRPDYFSETISHFIERKDQIANQVLDSITDKYGSSTLIDHVEPANEYLAEDIIAALTLGDLSLIESNLAWIESLISNHLGPDDLFSNYLRAYHKAAQTQLDEPGSPILDWLASIIQT